MQLTAAASRQLRTDGFTVIAGPVAPEEMERLAAAYDREILTADPAEIHEGSTTTRANDFVNRDPAFDFLYVHPPLLAACGLTLAGPFRLSTMHARTLRARTPAQRLHVDYPCDERGWPMLGFIFMIDEFRRDNGATRFLPRSQGLREMPAVAEREMPAVAEDDERLVPACGPAGRMIVFNGSVWHGHGPNLSREPRRSIQGAFIRREDKPAIDPARLHPETFSRLGATARILVGAKLDESK